MKKRRLLVPAVLMALTLTQAFDAAALGLARARGAVLIGRPLNVTIGATAEPGDPDVPCLEADVFQGDTRVNARRVGVRWEPGTGGTAQVRVTTEGVVEEPVVTIYLRVGCANKVTRRYVLLAEEPMEAERPAAASVPAQVMATPVPLPPPAAPRVVPAAPASVAPVAPSAVPTVDPDGIRSAPRQAPRLAARPPAVETRPRAPEARSRGTAPTAAPRSARLRLDPLDLTLEGDPALRSTARLQAEPAADEERRRQAAAMWKALSAGPEEAMKNSERLQSLERDVRSLHDLMAKNTAALELMRDQTLKARSERNTISLVAVGLSLLIAAAALAWAWRSRRQPVSAAAWWGRRSRPSDDSEFASEMPSQPAPRKAVKATQAEKAAASEPPDLNLDSGAPQESDPPARRAKAGPLSMPPRFSASSRYQVSEFQASIPGSSRMMKAEELIDIQQQADFFLSIDQPDRAIALLEAHIQQEEETSALAWMDLLEIYHDLGREEDYDRIREGFHERFNAQVPPFESYRHVQDSLENYGRALSRIMSLWPSRRVLEVIEESLMRKPGTADSEAFGLEAYRELVLLYNIGREVAQDAEEAGASLPRVSDFDQTNVMSLSVLHSHALNQPTPPSQAETPWPSENLGLDIDLGDFPSQPPAPAPTRASKEKDGPETDLDSLDWRSLR